MEANFEIKRDFAANLTEGLAEADGVTEVAKLLACTMPQIVNFLNCLRDDMTEHEILRCDLSGIALSAIFEFLDALSGHPCPKAARDKAVLALRELVDACEKGMLSDTGGRMH